MSDNTRLVSIVIPFFNEVTAVSPLFERLNGALDTQRNYRFEIVCVDDGSTDGTLAALLEAARRQSNVVVVELSRNFGKEAALTAGMSTAAGDAVVPLDADLQDPPELIGEMLVRWEEGFDVVLAKRKDRGTDTVAKRVTAKAFYKVNNLVSDVELPEDVGDFRLMDRAVIDALNQLPENRRFMKGLFAWVGFRTTTMEFRREPRSAGKTSFNAWRLWNLALEGITSFSMAPLRIWTYVGLCVALVAILYGTWILVRTLIWGVDLPGYASLLVAILFIGGLQLVGIGFIGEYLGRTYLESKRRPPFIIRRVTRGDN